MLESSSKDKGRLAPSLLFGMVTALCFGILGFLVSDTFQFAVYSTHPTNGRGFSLNTLHLAHGAFESWLTFSPGSPFVSSLLLGTLLTICIDQLQLDKSIAERLLCILPAMLLLLIAGNDIVVFSGVLVFVVYLLIVRRILAEKSSFAGLIPIATAAMGTLIAQELSLPLAVLACIAGLTLFDKKKGTPSLKAILGLTLLCLVPELLILFIKKEHSFPLYPTAQQIHPVVTAYGPIHVIDRNVIRALWGPFSQLLLLFLCLSGLIQVKSKSFSTNTLFLLLIALLLCLDTSIPEQYSQLAPLRGIARLFPDLYFIPVAPVLAAVTLVLVCVTFRHSRLSIFLSSGYLLCIPLVYPLLLAQESRYPLVESFIERISSQCLDSKIATSPSYRTIKEHNLDYLCNGSTLPQKVLLTEATASVTTSLQNRPKRAKRLIDGDRGSRWHSRQLGDEWIELSLFSPRTLAGIQLRQNKWPGNTPEKIQVMVGSSCARSDLKQVLSWSAGQESTLYLTNDGYPFVEKSSEAAGLWPPVDNVHCIRIEQHGKAKRPWSITAIEVITLAAPG